MFRIIAEHVFPFIRSMADADTAHAAHMKGARFTIPTPALLAKVVDLLAEIPMEDRDTKGDLYEYMLGKIAAAGQNGQFRTPRHIIGLMVELMAPGPGDVICDPACGTAGFLVGAGEYLRDNHPEIFRDEALRRHFHEGMFHGFDFDGTMLRIGSMNMILHGIEKATKHSPEKGRQQAKLYADALEARFDQRPVIFLSNGYEHWIWDDTRYPPRPVGGFYKRDELELAIQRRTGCRSLAAELVNLAIAGRPYQQRAIRAIGRSFDEAMQRKALLVMATGSGKTRTVIALVDLLMRAGWVKRFDLLMFSLELAHLKGSKRFAKLRRDLLDIVEALDGQTTIPGIAAQAELIEAVQTDGWWEGVTVPLLELVRLRLRDLVQHIEKAKRRVLYTDFADEIGEETEHTLPQVGAVDFVRFKQKARAFLRRHEDHIALHKLRQGKPLTATDLGELERMLLDAGIGDAGDIERARAVSDGFGRFVRSLVGLDRAAVAAAFGEFVAEGTATREQLEFIGLVVDHLTSQGVIEPKLLYESPFTDVAPQGPDRLFDEARTVRLFAVIEAINESAVA